MPRKLFLLGTVLLSGSGHCCTASCFLSMDTSPTNTWFGNAANPALGLLVERCKHHHYPYHRMWHAFWLTLLLQMTSKNCDGFTLYCRVCAVSGNACPCHCNLMTALLSFVLSASLKPAAEVHYGVCIWSGLVLWQQVSSDWPWGDTDDKALSVQFFGYGSAPRNGNQVPVGWLQGERCNPVFKWWPWVVAVEKEDWCKWEQMEIGVRLQSKRGEGFILPCFSLDAKAFSFPQRWVKWDVLLFCVFFMQPLVPILLFVKV